MSREHPVAVGCYRRHLQPRLLDLALSSGSTGDARRRVCRGLAGDVVEIGFGSGLNLPHLPPRVRTLSALEPSEVALRLAAKRRAASAVEVRVVGDDAQVIPLPDDRFDAALSTWTLCGIPDPVAALREVRRVLRPGGVLHFVEHGLSPDAAVARWQRRANGLNRRLVGCLLDRDVSAVLEASGLTVTELTTYYEDGTPRAAGYTYEGRATA